MHRILFCTPLLFAIFACSDAGGQAEQVARQSIQDQFPNYEHPGGAANCVRDNATPQEIATLSGQTGVVDDARLHAIVRQILGRLSTRACISSNNIPPLGSRG